MGRKMTWERGGERKGEQVQVWEETGREVKKVRNLIEICSSEGVGHRKNH